MICIGITGTIGAGKGTVVEYLVENKGFRHFSVRGFLLEKIRFEGLPEDRDSMFLLGNRLRAEYGPSYAVDCLYELACREKGNCVIESIRSTGEIISLRKKGRFYLMAIDADQTLRYKRIVERKSETDRISFSVFKENEEREMSSVDPARQNLRECIRLADFILTNNGTKEELFREVEKILMKI